MKLSKNLKLFKNSLSLLRDPLRITHPSLLLFGLVLCFYLLFWFVFSPLFVNALGTILEVGQALQEHNISPRLSGEFQDGLWSLSYTLFSFILTMFFLWSLFGSYMWKWIGNNLGKKTDNVLMPFIASTFVYTIYTWIIIIPSARLSFLFPSGGQLIILTTAAFLILLGLHFLFVSYGLLFQKKIQWKKLFKETFRRGTFKLPSYLFSYLLVAAFVVLFELLLRGVAYLHYTTYIFLGIVLLFPVLTIVFHFVTSVTLALGK